VHWLPNVLGLDQSSYFYAAYSAVIPDLALIAGVAGWYRHRNCHQKGCWRLGKHPDGDLVLCRHHHPRLD
jgi:hypothetical protein